MQLEFVGFLKHGRSVRLSVNLLELENFSRSSDTAKREMRPNIGNKSS